MKEHEKDNFVDFSKMTQPQIIMHHFRQFDQNKDGKVDGLEIFKKIQMENGKQYFDIRLLSTYLNAIIYIFLSNE